MNDWDALISLLMFTSLTSCADDSAPANAATSGAVVERSADDGDAAGGADEADAAEGHESKPSAPIPSFTTWSTPDGEELTDIAVAPNGGVYVLGTTTGDLATDNAGGSDAFLSLLTAELDVAWTVQWGGEKDESFTHLESDGDGNLYLRGRVSDHLGSNVVIEKRTPQGELLWRVDTETDSIGGPWVTVAGDVFLADPISGTLRRWTSEGEDVSAVEAPERLAYMVSAMDAEGNIWAADTRSIGNTTARKMTVLIALAPDGEVFLESEILEGSPVDIALSDSGEICLLGRTQRELDLIEDDDFELTPYSDRGENMYVTCVNSQGEVQWTGQWGTRTNDDPRALAIARDGSVIAVGAVNDDLDGIERAESLGTSINRRGDPFTTRWSSTGKLWSSLWGGDGPDRACAVVIAPNGDALVAGSRETGQTQNGLDAVVARFEL